MTPEDLQKIIERFDEEKLKKDAVFGIFQYGGGSDESYIRANKEGLELFALELLKSASYTDKVLLDKEKNIITLNYDEDWIDENSGTFIQYIEPIAEKQKVKPKEDYKDSIRGKLLPYGCGLIVIILLATLVIGIQTIFTWFF